jgi:hypothetical protein
MIPGDIANFHAISTEEAVAALRVLENTIAESSIVVD